MKLTIATALLTTLSVLPLQASFPAGSNTFSTATVIPTAVVQDESNVTTLDSFTAETGEPDYTGVKRTAWWVWTAPADGWATFSTEDNPFPDGALHDTHLAVFTGSAVNNLSMVGRNNDGIETKLSRVSFYAKTGTAYRVQVDSRFIGNTGHVVLSLRFLPAKAQRILTSGTDSMSNTLQFSVSTTASGMATGKLVLNGKAYALKSPVTVDGRFTAQIARAPLPDGQPVAPLILMVDLIPDGMQYHRCWVQNGLSSAEQIDGYRVTPFTTAAPHPLSPRFNASTQLVSANAGRGYITATIAKSGTVAMSGRTADGRAFTTSSALCDLKNGEYAAPLGTSAGKLTGIVSFEDKGAATDLMGGWDLNYRRLAPTSGTFYPMGIVSSMTITGAAYQAPTAGQRARGFLNATSGAGKIVFDTTSGEFSGQTLNTTLSVANRFTFESSPVKPKLTLNLTTGVVSGTAVLVPGKPARSLLGVLTMENGAPIIRGYVTGTTRTGNFRVGM